MYGFSYGFPMYINVDYTSLLMNYNRQFMNWQYPLYNFRGTDNKKSQDISYGPATGPIYSFNGGKKSESFVGLIRPASGPVYSFNGGRDDKYSTRLAMPSNGPIYNFTGKPKIDTFELTSNPVTVESQPSEIIKKEPQKSMQTSEVTVQNPSSKLNSDQSLATESSAAGVVVNSEAVLKTKPKAEVKVEPKLTMEERNEKLRKSFVTTAEKYLGCNEHDGSFKKFSDSPEWCADFVSYVIKEAYRDNHMRIPDGFGHHRCEIIKQWAIANNVFLKTAGLPNNVDVIRHSVREGDIMILRENGASHIGIVSYVNRKDGTFETIEGNVTHNGVDKVIKVNHYPTDPQISGFVQLA